MSTDAHTPVPTRPSADERERVVRILRDRSVEGRLSTDTLAERVGLAYEAKSAAELAELTSDVRPARRPRRALLAAVEWLSSLQADLEAAWHAQVWREGDRWFLPDLGSRNGTRVNRASSSASGSRRRAPAGSRAPCAPASSPGTRGLPRASWPG